MELYGAERSDLYRPRVPSRIPRSVPDEEYNEIFARLPSHRHRYWSPCMSPRAAGVVFAVGQAGGCGPGAAADHGGPEGNRELQELPASTDAFVWLRLYQVEMTDLIPKGRRQPL